MFSCKRYRFPFGLGEGMESFNQNDLIDLGPIAVDLGLYFSEWYLFNLIKHFNILKIQPEDY